MASLSRRTVLTGAGTFSAPVALDAFAQLQIGTSEPVSKANVPSVGVVARLALISAGIQFIK